MKMWKNYTLYRKYKVSGIDYFCYNNLIGERNLLIIFIESAVVNNSILKLFNDKLLLRAISV